MPMKDVAGSDAEMLHELNQFESPEDKKRYNDELAAKAAAKNRKYYPDDPKTGKETF